MYEPKSPISTTDDRVAADRARLDESLRNQYTGTTHRDRCLGAVRDIAHYSATGQTALAGEARRTLDTLCWSPYGYPEYVRDALRAACLRHTA